MIPDQRRQSSVPNYKELALAVNQIFEVEITSTPFYKTHLVMLIFLMITFSQSTWKFIDRVCECEFIIDGKKATYWMYNPHRTV